MKNTVTLRGNVTVSINDSRRMIETGGEIGEAWDEEQVGKLDIKISCNGSGVSDLRHVLGVAEQYRLASRGAYFQPKGESVLEAEGIDDMGDIVMRVFKGERRCDAIPLRELAALDPDVYRGEEAKKAIQWMRDTAREIQKLGRK